MAILNFSGFKDANTYAANTSLPVGLNNYMNGKFPCFKGNSAFVKDGGIKYSFLASAVHQFTFNNNLNEYGAYGFDITKFVGTDAPVGATLTFGQLVSTSITRIIYSGWLSNGVNSASLKISGGGTALGERYLEVQIKKTAVDKVTVTSMVNGVQQTPVDYALSTLMSDGKWLWIGYSAETYADSRYGATNGTLSITDMYVSYNTDGQDEFLGRPTISRVGATLVDKGSWTNPGANYADSQIAEGTTKTAKISLNMDTVPTISPTFANSRLADNPIIFKGENFTPVAGTSIRAVQVTAMSKSLDATVRTPQSVVLKNADSGDKISGAGTNALNVNTFTPASAIIDAPLDTNKLIVEVSATDYKP